MGPRPHSEDALGPALTPVPRLAPACAGLHLCGGQLRLCPDGRHRRLQPRRAPAEPPALGCGPLGGVALPAASKKARPPGSSSHTPCPLFPTHPCTTAADSQGFRVFTIDHGPESDVPTAHPPGGQGLEAAGEAPAPAPSSGRASPWPPLRLDLVHRWDDLSSPSVVTPGEALLTPAGGGPAGWLRSEVECTVGSKEGARVTRKSAQPAQWFPVGGRTILALQVGRSSGCVRACSYALEVAKCVCGFGPSARLDIGAPACCPAHPLGRAACWSSTTSAPARPWGWCARCREVRRVRFGGLQGTRSAMSRLSRGGSSP